jgi:hypothetical protein
MWLDCGHCHCLHVGIRGPLLAETGRT